MSFLLYLSKIELLYSGLFFIYCDFNSANSRRNNSRKSIISDIHL